MTVSPEQRFTAKARRGYSKEFLNQVCTCGCTRAAHKDRSTECVCGCPKFQPAAVQPHATPPKNFCFGTDSRMTRLPNGLREIPEDPESPIVLLEDLGPATQSAESGVPVPREGSATRCPFCHTNDFESVPAVKCASCKAWQHSACVREAGRCAACNAQWPV
jgi:hypothetical protein